MKVQILSNAGQAYINLYMFEDALQCCDEALAIDPGYSKALFRKAKALAFLF